MGQAPVGNRRELFRMQKELRQAVGDLLGERSCARGGARRDWASAPGWNRHRQSGSEK